MKSGSKALAITLLLVGLVLVNYLASSLPVRVDATADSIYSLSPGTQRMLGKIEESVTLEWLAQRLTEFVDENPDFEVAVERLATWLARLGDDD